MRGERGKPHFGAEFDDLRRGCWSVESLVEFALFAPFTALSVRCLCSCNINYIVVTVSVKITPCSAKTLQLT